MKQGSSGPWSDVILATATFYQDHASQIRKEGRPPKLSVMVGQAWTFFGLQRLGVEYARSSIHDAAYNMHSPTDPHITQSAAEAQMQKRVQVKPLSMTDADHQQQIWP